MSRFTPPSSWSATLLSVLRLIAALLLLQHGTAKVLGFPPTHDAHTSIPLNSLQALSGWLELILGALLAVGLFSRFCAFLLSGEMAVAYFMMHAPHGFYPILNKGELAVLYCFVFLYLAFAGPGPWSIDAWRRRG
jgi:putative oxidoreductase